MRFIEKVTASGRVTAIGYRPAIGCDIETTFVCLTWFLRNLARAAGKARCLNFAHAIAVHNPACTGSGQYLSSPI